MDNAETKPQAAPRSTFAYADQIEHRLRAASTLLGVSENTLRTTLTESGIEVRRANQDNPAAPAVRIFDLPTIFKIAEWRHNKKLTKAIEGKKPVVIAVQVIKGGTGKSTTACETGVQLALQGLKVLLIDVDIQSNLTQLLGYESDLELHEAAGLDLAAEAIVTGTFANICGPFCERKPLRVDAKTIIKYPFGAAGPAIIPSDTYFGELERSIEKSSGPRELTFKRFFEESSKGNVPGLNVSEFDVCIFDCPPATSFVTTNALAVADIIVAPVRMESFAVKGLSRLVSEIHAVMAAYKGQVRQPELVVLPTFYSNNVPRQGRMYDRLQIYREKLSPESISQSEEFPKSIEHYLPLTLLKPNCEPVREYRAFVDHLLKKIRLVAKLQESLTGA